MPKGAGCLLGQDGHGAAVFLRVEEGGDAGWASAELGEVAGGGEGEAHLRV